MNQKTAKWLRKIVNNAINSHAPEMPEKESDSKHRVPQYRFDDNFQVKKIRKGVPFRYSDGCRKTQHNKMKKGFKRSEFQFEEAIDEFFGSFLTQ